MANLSGGGRAGHPPRLGVHAIGRSPSRFLHHLRIHALLENRERERVIDCNHLHAMNLSKKIYHLLGHCWTAGGSGYKGPQAAGAAPAGDGGAGLEELEERSIECHWRGNIAVFEEIAVTVLLLIASVAATWHNCRRRCWRFS